jgi:hypothetical protein
MSNDYYFRYRYQTFLPYQEWDVILRVCFSDDWDLEDLLWAIFVLHYFLEYSSTKSGRGGYELEPF